MEDDAKVLRIPAQLDIPRLRKEHLKMDDSEKPPAHGDARRARQRKTIQRKVQFIDDDCKKGCCGEGKGGHHATTIVTTTCGTTKPTFSHDRTAEADGLSRTLRTRSYSMGTDSGRQMGLIANY